MDHIDLLRWGEFVARLKVLRRVGQVIKVPDFLPRIGLGEATTHCGRQFDTVCLGRQGLHQGNVSLLRFGPLFTPESGSRETPVAVPLCAITGSRDAGRGVVHSINSEHVAFGLPAFWTYRYGGLD